jgi:Tfp pilus assembly protein PilF
MTTLDHRTAAFSLVQRAMRIQLGNDDGELADAESCLLKALELDPNSIEALQEAAHFYDAVMPDAARVRDYASKCRDQATKVVAEMDEILAQDSREWSTARSDNHMNR